MLINLRDIAAIAEQANMAVGAFNTPSLEAVRAAIRAAEMTGLPVIIQHAECHEDIVGLQTIGPVMVALAERSEAAVCVHLDHCEHLFYMRRALEMGFSGAMYDGSAQPYDVNVENAARAAAMCHDFDCGLECELGSMGAREGDARSDGTRAESGDEAVLTDADQAHDFVEATGLDLLACSFGTVHGLYHGVPHLAFDVLERIRDRVQVPLVMHGGSGVSDDDYLRAINAGIRKINYYTYGAKFAGDAVRRLIEARGKDESGAVVYWHEMTAAAQSRLLEDFTQVMSVFANGAAPLA